MNTGEKKKCVIIRAGILSLCTHSVLHFYCAACCCWLLLAAATFVLFIVIFCLHKLRDATTTINQVSDETITIMQLSNDE